MNSIVKCIVLLSTMICIVMVLLVYTSACMEGAEEVAFWIRLHKCVEYIEEHGSYVDNPYLH